VNKSVVNQTNEITRQAVAYSPSVESHAQLTNNPSGGQTSGLCICRCDVQFVCKLGLVASYRSAPYLTPSEWMMLMMVMMTCSIENCVQTYCMKGQLRGFRCAILQGVLDLLLRSVNGMGGYFKVEWIWNCMLLLFEWGMACQKLSSIVCPGSHSKCQLVH
jgi:hypothetical protein